MNKKSIALILPPEIHKCLSRAEILCADLIIDLCRGTASRVPSRAMYSCVSQQWLAKRVGVTRTWISRCVTKLHKMGILDLRHRRKVKNQFTSNIYRVGEALKKGYKTAKALYLEYISRVQSAAHIVHKKKERRKESKEMKMVSRGSGDKSFDEVMASCLKRLETL